MAFLAPLVGVALQAAGVGALGSALITTALGVGVSFLSNRIRGKEQSRNASVGARVGLTISTNASRQWVVGETANGGSLVFWHLSGNDNEKLWMVIALADHECQSLQSVIVAGKNKSWDAGTGNVADFSGKLKVRFYSGAAGQTADSALVAASGGRWLSTAVGVGVCYVVVEAVFDERLFPGGIPELGFVIRGAKLFDTRTSTTAYTANAALAVYAALRGVSVAGQPLIGMSAPSSAVRSAEMDAAASIADEDVTLGAGGSEDRYRVGCVFDSDMSNQEVLEILIGAMAGEIIETGGIYRVMAGAARTPVASLTDEDFITLVNGSPEPMTYKPKHGRNQLVNSVTGTYYEPSANYGPVASPLRVSSGDVDADGGYGGRLTMDLSAVTSRTQAQRILEIERRKARRMGILTGQLRALHFGIEVGDWVSITSARRGFENKVFDLTSAGDQFDLRKSCAFSEMDDEFDDWSTSLEIDDEEVSDLPPAGPSFTAISGLSASNVVVTAGGSGEAPGIHATWTPVTDPTATRILIQYRKVGDTTALEVAVLDPSVSGHTWTAGVQGNTEYEIRAIAQVSPQRAMSWTSWVSTGSDTDPQIVDVAALAEAVPPDTITIDMLDAQARFELSLTTAAAAIQGSVQERVDAFSEQLQAFAAAQLEHRRVTGETRSRVLVTERTIQTNAESFASYVVEATAELDAQASAISGLESRVTVTEDGVEAAEARAYLAINVVGPNGVVTGGIDIYGNSLFSIITLLSDKLVIAKPDGTGAKQIFTTGIRNGVSNVVVLDADLVMPDSAIQARHISVATLSAIAADIGTVTAGLIRDASNTYQIQVANGLLTSTDGKAYLDLKNKRLRFTP